MKCLLWTSLLLLAACAVQTGAGSPPRAPETGGGSPGQARGAAEAVPGPTRSARVARVGVEYMPAASGASRAGAGERAGEWAGRGGAAADAIIVETARSAEPATSDGSPEALRAAETPWSLDDEQLQAIDNPVERLTLQFVRNVIGEDHRRVQRHIGAPILFSHGSPSAGALESVVDERDREDQTFLVARDGTRMLGKPLLSALRDSTFVRDLELALDDFKSSTLSFDAPGAERQRLGRISLRVRTSDLRNPAEVTYVHSGWRVGTSAETFKVSYSVPLAPLVTLSLRTRYDYSEGDLDLWGDLWWQVNKATQVHVLAGDKVDLITGTYLYPLVQSPFVLETSEESPGVLAYVEHLF